MGNTSIPQFGAIVFRISRGTLAGEARLTEEQKRERQDAQAHSVGPSRDRPANAPERIPDQQRDPDDAEDVEGVTEGDGKRDRDSDAERPADGAANTGRLTGAGGRIVRRQ